MSLPPHYKPEAVADLFDVNVAAITAAGAATNTGTLPKEKTYLLLVDIQVDFVHPEGSLAVPGAVEDTRRTVEWLYNNLAEVTTIGATLDTHIPGQIFYPQWWVNADGEHPAPYTQITLQDVSDGRWNPIEEPEWSLEYLRQLEERAKKTLVIWPYHTMLGTRGHMMMPALYEALVYHAAAHNTRPNFILKGMIPKTEHYSAMETEVKVPSDPSSALNTSLLEDLATYDRIVVVGQAKSHCVLETVNSMARYYTTHHPNVLERITLFSDCMSSVQHPEVDFEAIAQSAFQGLMARGIQVNTSA